MIKQNLPRAAWRDKVHIIIFGADTPAGKLFDIVLVISIFVSVLAVTLDSVPSIHANWKQSLLIIEWVTTILFTLEYFARLASVTKPSVYAFSFMGIVDLLSTLPSYIGLFMGGANYAMALRLLRLLRIFRVLL